MIKQPVPMFEYLLQLFNSLIDVASFSAVNKVNKGQSKLIIIKQAQRSKTCSILVLQENYLEIRLFVKLDSALKNNGVSI